MRRCSALEEKVADGVIALRVQVPNNHILTQNLYYNYYYPNSKYLIVGYMDPLGRSLSNSLPPRFVSHT